MLWVLIRSPLRGTSNEYHNICFGGDIHVIEDINNFWLKKDPYLELCGFFY